MKVALLCSGLGHIVRGHEVFARDLFAQLRGDIDITLFRGGGDDAPGERVIPNVARRSPLLREVHVCASPRWADAVREAERMRIEARTFAYAALAPLLEGGYDIVHCLEDEVCNVIHDHRHLFAKVPKILFSNGGAIPARDLPRCDAVHEYTAHNLRYSRREAFLIPHGVDVERFRPGLARDARGDLRVDDAQMLVISVGTICHSHKRMDHVIREIAPLPDVRLLIVGQPAHDTPRIRALGEELLGTRVSFLTVEHAALPALYAAADVFVLGSLFETFGIVYIEAMAMGLPVVCTRHVNQQSIVQQGVFVDMAAEGALTRALRETPKERWRELGRRGREIAEREYDWRRLRCRYAEEYARIAALPSSLPAWNAGRQLRSHARNALRRVDDLVRGRPE